MEIIQKIKSSNNWYYKGYGVVFVDKQENIKAVYDLLVEQDSYWEREDEINELIKVVPENFAMNKVLTEIEYTYKMNIYDVIGLIVKAKMLGIDIFVWSQSSEDER